MHVSNDYYVPIFNTIIEWCLNVGDINSYTEIIY